MLLQVLQLIHVTANLLLQLRVVVHDIFHCVASKAANLLETVLHNVPNFLSSLDGGALVFGHLLDFFIGLLDNGVYFVAVLGANGIEVIKGAVDVAASAGDEGRVAESSRAEPLECFVGFGSCGLEFLCCLEHH